MAVQLGVGNSTLEKWVHAHRKRTGELAAMSQAEKRIRELERQEAHLQEVNDIQKKQMRTLPIWQIGGVKVKANATRATQHGRTVHGSSSQPKWSLRLATEIQIKRTFCLTQVNVGQGL